MMGSETKQLDHLRPAISKNKKVKASSLAVARLDAFVNSETPEVSLNLKLTCRWL
jgi:hypothetical protein